MRVIAGFSEIQVEGCIRCRMIVRRMHSPPCLCWRAPRCESGGLWERRALFPTLAVVVPGAHWSVRTGVDRNVHEVLGLRLRRWAVRSKRARGQAEREQQSKGGFLIHWTPPVGQSTPVDV